MDIKHGDIIKYYFPHPLSITKNSIVGHVDYIGEDFIFLQSGENIRLKITFKNFGNIRKLGSIEENSIFASTLVSPA